MANLHVANTGEDVPDNPMRPPHPPAPPAPDVIPVRDPQRPEHPDPVREPPGERPPVATSEPRAAAWQPPSVRSSTLSA